MFGRHTTGLSLLQLHKFCEFSKLPCIIGIVWVELVGSVVIVSDGGIVRASCIVGIVGVQLV